MKATLLLTVMQNRAKRIPLGLALAVAVTFLHQDATAAIVLGTAADFAILGGTSVTFTAPTTTVTGDVGVSPGTSITGAGANLTLTGASAIRSLADSGTAQSAVTTAFGAVSSLATTGSLGSDLTSQNLTSGVYDFVPGTVLLNGTLTLSGSGLFVFRVPSDLTTGVGSNVSLINGADACNVIWQVQTKATLGTSSFFDGTILAGTAIALGDGVTMAGRLLAKAEVTLIHDTIVTDVGCQPGEGTGSFHTTGVPGEVAGVPGVVAGVPDSGSAVLLLGFGLASLIVFRTISLQSLLQAGC